MPKLFAANHKAKSTNLKAMRAPGPMAPGFPVDTPAKQPSKKSSLKQSPKR